MKKLYMLLALAGIFAACQPEELQTTFEVDAAKAVINVECIDIQTNQPVSATLTTSTGVVNGSQVILTGNKELPATEVTITAEYQGKKYFFDLILSKVDLYLYFVNLSFGLI